MIVKVDVGVLVEVDVSVTAKVGAGVDVSVRVGEGVAEKKSLANSACVKARSVLAVGVGEPLGVRIISGWTFL